MQVTCELIRVFLVAPVVAWDSHSFIMLLSVPVIASLLSHACAAAHLLCCCSPLCLSLPVAACLWLSLPVSACCCLSLAVSACRCLSLPPAVFVARRQKGDGVVYVWDVAARECVFRHRDEGCVNGTCIAVSPCGRFYATG